MIVVVTAEAESDLEQIATHIAEQSIEIALNFVQELREKCESLADAPRGAQILTPNSSAWADVRFLDDGREEIRRSCISTEDCREQRPRKVFPAYRAAGPAKA
ncbi:MAG TPA: type II toxin-antitoxin system RelE/ParE family toxin [Bradyrhizobium sp.]|nr:type II toxin-antitoxin system RelE/ParE family toxin [Bradyrhizobium sp.]